MNAKNQQDDLSNPSNWDFSSAEERTPVKQSRSIVSVAFAQEDFELVAGRAEQMHMKLSAFIREAAIEKALGRGNQGKPVWMQPSTPFQTMVTQTFPYSLTVTGNMVIEPLSEVVANSVTAISTSK